MSRLAREIEYVIFADCLDNIILFMSYSSTVFFGQCTTFWKKQALIIKTYTLTFQKNFFLALIGKPNKKQSEWKE